MTHNDKFFGVELNRIGQREVAQMYQDAVWETLVHWV
jgi:hypothetical protein